MSNHIDHNLNVGDCITPGAGKDVYYVTEITDAYDVKMICVTPTSDAFANRTTQHIIELANGFKKIHYLGDILDERKAIKLVGMQLWRPIFFKCGSLHAMEKVVIQYGIYDYNNKVQLNVTTFDGMKRMTVPDLFYSVADLDHDSEVFGFWVDKNGIRPSDYSGSAITCQLNGYNTSAFAPVDINMKIRAINSTDTQLGRIRMIVPNGIVLADETFIPNTDLSKYVSSDGKRLVRLPATKTPNKERS